MSNINVDVISYSPRYKGLWDNFVTASKNGVFLFYRDYMEYHSDRFKDHSLIFLRNGKVIGLLPGNIKNGAALCTHEGLTFGGVISGYDTKTSVMLGIFDALIKHCQEHAIKEIVYKAIPYIYHSVPANEDLYALFRHNAKLMARNASSCIYLPEAPKFSDSRKDNIRKAKKNHLIVKESEDFATFMQIVEGTLAERHGVKPVHSVDEIRLLASMFPDNIKLFASYKDGRMLAGTLIYESGNVAHVQYAANSKEGWNMGAQDIIEDYLINEYYKGKRYYDFGISTEKLGQVLNLGLIARKEGFGASTVNYDIYQILL